MCSLIKSVPTSKMVFFRVRTKPSYRFILTAVDPFIIIYFCHSGVPAVNLIKYCYSGDKIGAKTRTHLDEASYEVDLQVCLKTLTECQCRKYFMKYCFCRISMFYIVGKLSLPMESSWSYQSLPINSTCSFWLRKSIPFTTDIPPYHTAPQAS